ncbi:MAG: hypothetical protein KC636_36785, partial [Myxococcales bacterium]|nr:hypothetical protein [Myxococcales bacterium]
RTRLELRGALRAQGAVGLAALPDLDGGGGLVLALFARPFRVELGASAWALGQYVHPTADVASSLRFWSGSLRAGPSARLGPIELHVLGHFEVGALIVSAAPLENASRQTAAWIALGLAPSLAWAPHRNVALWLGVEGFGVLLRPRYTIGALGDYYVARPAGVRGVLGVEARFP